MKKILMLCTVVGALPSQAGWVGNIYVPDEYDEAAAMKKAIEASQEESASSEQSSLALSEEAQLERALKLSMKTLEEASKTDTVASTQASGREEASFMQRRDTLRKSDHARAVDARRRVSGVDQLARHGDQEEKRILEESAFLHTMNTLRQKADTKSKSTIDDVQEKRRKALRSSDVGSELAKALMRRKKMNGE